MQSFRYAALVLVAALAPPAAAGENPGPARDSAERSSVVAGPSGEPTGVGGRVLCVPLVEGRIALGPLARALAAEAGAELESEDFETVMLPASEYHSGRWLAALEYAMGPGTRIVVEGDEVVVRLGDGLVGGGHRRDAGATEEEGAAEEGAAEEATGEMGRGFAPEDRERALQAALVRIRASRRAVTAYGLFARPSYRPNDPEWPTVCLVHGLDDTAASFERLAVALEEAGYGVVLYQYPNDQPIAASARMFARDLAYFRRAAGERKRWHIVGHSMGGLAARACIEDPEIAGTLGEPVATVVDRLILIAPPNHGSALARGRIALECYTYVRDAWLHRASVWSTLADGRGEAGDDLRPGSRFLATLNALPRHPEVRYTILAGDHSPLVDAELLARIQHEIERRRFRNPLVRYAQRRLSRAVARALPELIDGQGDGAIAVASTRLEGVDDHEVLHAEHLALLGIGPFAAEGEPPCLGPILERLGERAR